MSIELRKGAERPCFVYMALTAPHVPLAPSEPFRGKHPLGRYGDFCLEVDDAGEDSVGNLALLPGRPYAKPLHPVIIHQASNGSLGITKGKWKLELCKGNGGWGCPYDGKDPKTLPGVRLYDVAADPNETTDLRETHPDIVAALRAALTRCQESGRTRR